MTTQTTVEATMTARPLDELIGEAHASTYRFPADLGGFAVTLSMAGAGWRADGSVTARGPSHVEVGLDAEEGERAWATKELTSLVAHRWHQPYEAGGGRHPRRRIPRTTIPWGGSSASSATSTRRRTVSSTAA